MLCNWAYVEGNHLSIMVSIGISSNNVWHNSCHSHVPTILWTFKNCTFNFWRSHASLLLSLKDGNVHTVSFKKKGEAGGELSWHIIRGCREIICTIQINFMGNGNICYLLQWEQEKWNALFCFSWIVTEICIINFINKHLKTKTKKRSSRRKESTGNLSCFLSELCPTISWTFSFKNPFKYGLGL